MAVVNSLPDARTGEAMPSPIAVCQTLFSVVENFSGSDRLE
jgi:hypothetical protein